MSRINDTRQAYDKLVALLDQEIRKRSGSVQDLTRYRQTLDVAFYLLGWGQFEHLIRKEAEDRIDSSARTNTVDGHAWRYLKENVKSVSVRRRLDLIFHEDPNTRSTLDREYTVRNEAAHDYKLLPREASDVSVWLTKLEGLINKF